jgi:alpha-L-arabinofuranosidase
MITKRPVVASIVLLAAALLTAVQARPASAASASVTVNATAGLGSIPAHAIGVNTAVYDGDMNDAAIPPLLKAAGVTAMRYPGGSYSDIYNFQTQTAAEGGFVAPNSGFTNFMSTANAAGAQPIITVNYGTGTPSLAGSWAQAAASDSVGFWEVGNEVYGNGTYGANWEADAHCKSTLNGTAVTIGSEPSQTFNCGPAEYAANVKQFQSSMHAADPNAKVCAIVTTPGFWPDNVTNSEYPQSWNQTVLTALGSGTQCVVVHYYPAGGQTAVTDMLNDPSDIAGIISTLHSEISQFAGIANAASIPVLVTETNSTIDKDTQPAALFGADMLMTWLENGAVNVDWWNEHNGAGTSSTVNGATDFGDEGIFSNNSSQGGTTEPAVDTPFAPYYGIQMLSKLAPPGGTMVTATSSQALLKVHAVRDASGNLNVLVDNEDPTNSYTVSLALNGFTAAGTPTVYTLANNATSITSASGSASSVTAAPYSLTVVHVPGSGGTGVTAPGAPGTPVASGLSSSTSSNTSGTATLTWPASTPGTNPVANYQVFQAGAGGSTTLAATTTSTSVTLTGLTIGTTYTYNVVAVDSKGNPSLPSPPVTFTVPPPSNASCAVHYSIAGSWPGGFQGGVTITNKGSAAINGWTLTWTWPSTGEALTQMWGASYTQTGTAVSAVNASYTATLGASGGTQSFGFLANDGGQLPAPAAFFLNGSICANN